MFVCPPKKVYLHSYFERFGSNCISKCIQQNIYIHNMCMCLQYTIFSYHIVGLWIFFCNARLMSSIATLLIRELSLQHTVLAFCHPPMISISHLASYSTHDFEWARIVSVVVFDFLKFSLYLFVLFCFALLQINTCVCCLTRRHCLRLQYFTFTHNLRKLIGKRREMKTFTMSHKSSTHSHYGNFKIRGTFDPTASRLKKGIHTHTHSIDSTHKHNKRKQSCICSADDKNNINLLLHKFEFDFKYGYAEFKWNIFRAKNVEHVSERSQQFQCSSLQIRMHTKIHTL